MANQQRRNNNVLSRGASSRMSEFELADGIHAVTLLVDRHPAPLVGLDSQKARRRFVPKMHASGQSG
jgi:hypothetical protein